MRIKAKSEQKLLTSENKVKYPSIGEKKSTQKDDNDNDNGMTTKKKVNSNIQKPRIARVNGQRYQFEMVAFYGEWKS